jgi:uncharacterized protein YkwD
MALRDFFSHNNPDGLSAINRAQANGYPNSYVGENLGAGRADASAMLSDWMKSPAHMANITNCQYTETGIGYYDQADDQNNVRLFNGSTGGPYRYYWTQVFGNPNL